MSKLATISFLILLSITQISCEEKINSNTEFCFSETNFKDVYNFIKIETQNNKSKAYVFEEWEIHLNDMSEICFRKNESLIAKANKEKGIFSLAIYKDDNTKISLKTNEIFCKLVSLANKYKLNT